MSEQDQQQYDSPLVSERGRTIISDTVVSTIAGGAAQEVEGVHMGGSASRAAGGILGSITGSESQTRGVSVEIGTVEAAVDLTMGIEYGRDILPTVDEVRRRISDRVQNMTGLRVTELNVTISDIIFPERGARLRRALEDGTRTEARPLPEAGERETTEVSPSSRTRTEGTSGPLAEEETRAEEQPEGDETAEIRPEDVSETRRSPEEDETRRSEESEPPRG
ncbi:MAG: Asp23/Gls24 family envelope stress response protein [Actinobacteria bacterium]|nr:Asp23/Gls24 family envelope stress response protein [Actinomycetota bacterium]